MRGARSAAARARAGVHACVRRAGARRPDRTDWTYPVGAPAKFLVGVTSDGKPIAGATVRCTIGPEMMPVNPAPTPVAIPAGDTLALAAYNVITAPKTLTLALETGHTQTPEQQAMDARWLDGMLGLRQQP